jgi:hypothetical protein
MPSVVAWGCPADAVVGRGEAGRREWRIHEKYWSAAAIKWPMVGKQARKLTFLDEVQRMPELFRDLGW